LGLLYLEEFDVNVSDILDMSADDVVELLKKADNAYYNDAVGPDTLVIDDATYDKIRQVAESMYPTHPYFAGVGSDVRGGKIKLPYPMGSLNQVYEGEYAKWVADHQIENEQTIITHKLDGGSDMIIYGPDGNLQIAYSRGDGYEGADITRHISQIPTVPSNIDNDGVPLTIRAEHIIKPTNFDKLKKMGITSSSGKPYKNPRNMVSGIMNASSNDDRVYEYIDVVAYEIVGSTLSKSAQLATLARLGFSVVKFVTGVAKSFNDANLTKILNDARASSPYELDGLVIDIDSSQIRNRLRDPDSLNPAYAVKFKVASADNSAIAEVIGVEWNLSKHGYFKPRVCIKPVELVGVTVQHATGFNAKFIVDNGIGPGAKIAITRSGDVIPYITSVIERSTPELPTEEYFWTDTGVDIYTLNEPDEVKLQKLVDFFTSIDVPKLKEGNLASFVDLGITDPATIIDLSIDDICNVVGSKSIGKDIYIGIHDRLRNIPEYVLMGSTTTFGRGVGVRKMKKLWEAFAGDMSRCVDVQSIVNVEGFDTKTAEKIANGYPEYQSFLSSIRNHVKFTDYVPPVEGALTGSTIVFTGFRSSDMEKQIIAAGGKMGSSVSKNTTYLVTNDPHSTSGKSQKARDLGVKVISPKEMQELLDA
jgi:DNA ligase (NAD+)